MNVNGVSATGTPTDDRQTSIAGDFDTFLRLLTTQLANQDPLSPMDSNQFTEQLVQFASVEQSVATNAKLDDILGLVRAEGLSVGAEYLGREIEVDGASLHLGPTGTAAFTMNVAERPAAVTVGVLDDAGQRIATFSPPPKEGPQTIVWDGRADDGFRAPSGSYSVVIDARNLSGTLLPVSTRVSGTVTAVDNENGDLLLQVGDRRVPLADVLTIRTPAQGKDDEGVSS